MNAFWLKTGQAALVYVASPVCWALATMQTILLAMSDACLILRVFVLGTIAPSILSLLNNLEKVGRLWVVVVPGSLVGAAVAITAYLGRKTQPNLRWRALFPLAVLVGGEWYVRQYFFRTIIVLSAITLLLTWIAVGLYARRTVGLTCVAAAFGVFLLSTFSPADLTLLNDTGSPRFVGRPPPFPFHADDRSRIEFPAVSASECFANLTRYQVCHCWWVW